MLRPMRQSNDLYCNLSKLQTKVLYNDENTFGAALQRILSDVKKDWDTYSKEQEYDTVHKKALTH